MTLGSWVAVNMWVSQIFMPLNFLGSVYGMIVQSLVDIRNLSELLMAHPDIVDEPGATDIMIGAPKKLDGGNNTNSSSSGNSGNSSVSVSDIEMMQVSKAGETSGEFKLSKSQPGVKVEFKNIHFNYPAQPVEKGLKDVSFTVLPGTTTAIVGSTGAGKTTISRLLFRFYDPKEGTVCIDGKNIKNYTQQSVRRIVGIVPQDTVLFNDTIKYNIRYGKMDATDEEVLYYI
jgi:ABC-type transport system involved in Fe-S cluster assembly fused permease/ATPase subunit